MNLSSDRILITGAAGSLGKQLIFELEKRGVKPIAHVRESSDTTYIDSLGLEKRTADLRNKKELKELVQGVDSVIHTAAWVDFRRNRLTQFTGINTFAAVDLFRLANQAGVKRFLHVSSVAGIGAVRRNGRKIDIRELANENTEYNLNKVRVPYIMTKRAAEVELMKLQPESSTELVIVNPSIMVAPVQNGDDRARFMKMFSKFILPEINNRVNVVDIRDVAPAILTALGKGKNGERYILAGDNISVRDLFLAASSVLKKIPHLVNFPRSLVNTAARASVMSGRVFGKSKISFYPDIVKLLNYDWVYSSEKARENLNYKNRSIHITLDDLLTNHFYGTYLKPKP